MLVLLLLVLSSKCAYFEHCRMVFEPYDGLLGSCLLYFGQGVFRFWLCRICRSLIWVVTSVFNPNISENRGLCCSFSVFQWMPQFVVRIAVVIGDLSTIISFNLQFSEIQFMIFTFACLLVLYSNSSVRWLLGVSFSLFLVSMLSFASTFWSPTFVGPWR